MSVEAMAWVLNYSPVSGTDKVVLLGIANHADHTGANAWPSVETLARYANVDSRNVQRSLGKMRRDGLIAVEVQRGGLPEMSDDRRPNRYTIVGVAPVSPRGVTSPHERGGAGVANRVARASPKPSPEPSIEGNELFTPTGVPRENGATNPEISRLVAGYVDDYKSERANKLPPAEWRGAAGKAAARALKNGERPDDIAEAFGIIAHEGKQPSSLPHVLADYHANRPRRSYQR